MKTHLLRWATTFAAFAITAASLTLAAPASASVTVNFMPVPVGIGPNPRVVAGTTFGVYNSSGVLMPSTSIVSWGGAPNGLYAGFRTLIKLPVPLKIGKLLLTHFGSPVKVNAYSSGGVLLASAMTAAPSGATETLYFTGSGIQYLIVFSPQSRVALHYLYFE
jgi:hypothetical protein